jgi:hypothetical protein
MHKSFQIILTLVLISSLSQAASAQTVEFLRAVKETLSKATWTVERAGKQTKIKGKSLEEVCHLDDAVERRLFVEYGAMYLGVKGITHPWRCIFDDQAGVDEYQKIVPARTENIGGTTITLQTPAMEALLKAIEEAKKKGKSITPRGGPTAAKRAYEDTAKFWNSRLLPGLDYWIKQSRLTRDDAESVKALPVRKQIAQVLEWEDKGIFFATGFQKSILYSVAAPGGSQHLFMLALDVTEFSDPEIREILMKHGWFQTVKSDQPHFTFLGREEHDLSKLGLVKWTMGDQRFWIPASATNSK